MFFFIIIMFWLDSNVTTGLVVENDICHHIHFWILPIAQLTKDLVFLLRLLVSSIMGYPILERARITKSIQSGSKASIETVLLSVSTSKLFTNSNLFRFFLMVFSQPPHLRFWISNIVFITIFTFQYWKQIYSTDIKQTMTLVIIKRPLIYRYSSDAY